MLFVKLPWWMSTAQAGPPNSHRKTQKHVERVEEQRCRKQEINLLKKGETVDYVIDIAPPAMPFSENYPSLSFLKELYNKLTESKL